MFEWDEGNIAHIALHAVTVAEAEYVLRHPTLEVGFQDWHGEERFSEVGATAAGRILTIWTTMRGDKIRVVTAFDATRADAERYLRRMT